MPRYRTQQRKNADRQNALSINAGRLNAEKPNGYAIKKHQMGVQVTPALHSINSSKARKKAPVTLPTIRGLDNDI